MTDKEKVTLSTEILRRNGYNEEEIDRILTRVYGERKYRDLKQDARR